MYPPEPTLPIRALAICVQSFFVYYIYYVFEQEDDVDQITGSSVFTFYIKPVVVSWCGLKKFLNFNYFVELLDAQKKKSVLKIIENQFKGHTPFFPVFFYRVYISDSTDITACDDFSYHLSPHGSSSMLCVCVCLIFRPPTTNGTSSPLSLRVFFFFFVTFCVSNTYAHAPGSQPPPSTPPGSSITVAGGRSSERRCGIVVCECAGIARWFLLLYFFPDETPTIEYRYIYRYIQQQYKSCIPHCTSLLSLRPNVPVVREIFLQWTVFPRYSEPCVPIPIY